MEKVERERERVERTHSSKSRIDGTAKLIDQTGPSTELARPSRILFINNPIRKQTQRRSALSPSLDASLRPSLTHLSSSLPPHPQTPLPPAPSLSDAMPKSWKSWLRSSSWCRRVRSRASEERRRR